MAREFEASARVADLARALQNAADVEATLRSEVSDAGITVSYLIAQGSGFLDRHGDPSTRTATGQVSTDVLGPRAWSRGWTTTPTDRSGDARRGGHRPSTPRHRQRPPRRQGQPSGRRPRGVKTPDRHTCRLRAQAPRARPARRRTAARPRPWTGAGHGFGHHDDPQTQEVVHRCLATTHVVLGELRDLSHGFYPASLEQTGLGNALDGIVDGAPVPVTFTRITHDGSPRRPSRRSTCSWHGSRRPPGVLSMGGHVLTERRRQVAVGASPRTGCWRTSSRCWAGHCSPSEAAGAAPSRPWGAAAAGAGIVEVS